MQGEMGEEKPRWISKILKYDVEIWSTKLIRGRALCEQLANEVKRSEDVTCFIEQETSDVESKAKENDCMS